MSTTPAEASRTLTFAGLRRATFDAIVLLILAKRLLPVRAPLTSKTILLTVAAFVTLGLGAVLQGLVLKGVFLLVAILTFSFVARFVLFSREERNLALGFLRFWVSPGHRSTEIR